MLDTTDRVTDPSGLIVVADASFVIGISLLPTVGHFESTCQNVDHRG